MLGTAHLNQWFWMEGDLASASQGACLEALCRSGRGRGRGWHLGLRTAPTTESGAPPWTRSFARHPRGSGGSSRSPASARG